MPHYSLSEKESKFPAELFLMSGVGVVWILECLFGIECHYKKALILASCDDACL
jgi:hypothetical protein